MLLVIFGAGVIGAAGLYAYAFSLAGPIGRNRLALGVPELLRDLRSWGHHGEHEAITAKDETPTYDGEPVRGLTRRSEDERAAAYAAMREQAVAEALPVSGAALMAFAEELQATAPGNRELLVELAELEARLVAEFREQVDHILAEFLSERTAA